MFSNSNQSTQSHSRWENSKRTKWNGTLPAEPTWKRKSYRKTKTKKAWRRNDCHLNNTCVSNAFITVVCDVYEKWDCINCMEILWKNLRKSYWEFRNRLKWYVFLLIGVASESKGGCVQNYSMLIVGNRQTTLQHFKHRTFCSFFLLALCFLITCKHIDIRHTHALQRKSSPKCAKHEKNWINF